MNTPRFVLLPAIVVWISVACATSSQAGVAEPSGKLLIKGTVVKQDGSPAAGATIESANLAAERPTTVQADAQGHFKLVALVGHGCQLYARSADDAEQAVLVFSGGEARTRFARPVEFKLAPAVEKSITVSSAVGDPVAGAQVVAEGKSYRTTAVTGPDGIARVKVPAGDRLQAVTAWHPTLGAAGQRDRKKGLEGDAFQLALLPTARHTVRLLAVDGRPLAGLEVGVSVRTSDNEWVITRDVKAAHMVTDENGEASATWFPQNALGVDVDLVSREWKIDDIERDKLAQGITTARARRKVAVVGRLKMPAGASAEGIVVSGFGYGPQHRGDIPTARAAADGSFTLSVAADHGYSLYINDIEWAGDGWTGLILADEDSKPAEIQLEVYRATPLEVRVTRGEGHEPIVDASVYSRCDRDFSFRNSKGAIRNARAGSSQGLLTDAKGIARLGVAKGEVKVRLDSGDWTEERTVSITSDSPQFVEFYRPWRTNRKVTGRLLVEGAVHKPSPSAVIEAAAIAPSYQRFSLKASLNADGTFEVEGDAGDISILVIDREQRRGGFVRIGASDSTVDLQLLAMGSYAGTVVDHEGQPHARELLRLAVKDTDHLAAEDLACDDLGRFSFPLALAGAPLVVQVRQQTPDGSYFRQVDELLLMPSETRENPRLVADLRNPAELRTRSKSSAPLSEQIALAARNARLSGMHALVILQGASSEAMTRLVEAISNYDDQPDILAYVPLFVDEKTLKSNGETLKELDWPLPKRGEAVLVALDGDAGQLRTQRLEVADVNAAGKLAMALLKKHLPPVRDAQARLTAAREEASGSGRKVWIVEGGRAVDLASGWLAGWTISTRFWRRIT